MRRRAGSLLAAGAAALTLAGVTVRAQDTPGGGPTTDMISDEGQQIYEQICQACHMADAKGGGDAGAVIPALAGNSNLADPKFAINVVLKGRGGMPWFNDMLAPEQIAAVINYVRGHFNAYGDKITTDDVKAAMQGDVSPSDCMTCN